MTLIPGGFMDVDSYRFRVLKPLAEKLGLPQLNFQILRGTLATQAEKMGSAKRIRAHLQRPLPGTTAHERMQEFPERVQQTVRSLYLM